MKTAEILKKSVLTPGNNWISLLNSANLSKKKAVTSVNFHLYHYAGNNPIKYTDPDGRDHGMPPAIEQQMKQRLNVTPIEAAKLRNVRVNGNTTASCGISDDARRVLDARGSCSYGTTSDIRQKIAQDNGKRTDPDGIYAVKTGYICKSEVSADYGNTIVIKQKDGKFMRYAHLSTINFEEGDWVVEGQKIGVMGDTGNGPHHLHVSTYPESAEDDYSFVNAIIDPMDVIRQGTYPCNRKVSGLFHEQYEMTLKDGTKKKYLHEGLDFSGQNANLIGGWEKGLNGREALNAQGY